MKINVCDTIRVYLFNYLFSFKATVSARRSKVFVPLIRIFMIIVRAKLSGGTVLFETGGKIVQGRRCLRGKLSGGKVSVPHIT